MPQNIGSDTIFAIMLMFTAISCGGGQTSIDTDSETKIEQGSSFSGNKSIDGEWVIPAEDEDDEESLTIDGDSAVLIIWTAHKGTVDRGNSTITFDDGTVMEYEIIGDKLVLTSESTGALAFERKK